MRPSALRAIYAGSYDPFTYGHKAVAEEAINIFGNVIIAIGTNGSKTPLFNIEEKIDIVKSYWPGETFGAGQKIDVVKFSGLLTQFCQEWTEDRVVLIRGLRAISDFESEMVIAAANRRLYEKASTVFVPTQPDVAFISSSVVKEIARNTRKIEDLIPYVTHEVATDLTNRLRPKFHQNH